MTALCINPVYLILIASLMLNCETNITDSNKVKVATAISVNDPLQNFSQNRNIWITVKTVDQEAVAKIIGLQNYAPSSWEFGLKKSNWNPAQAFISPVINNELVMIIGRKLSFYPTSKNLMPLLEKLSAKFGEVNYYYNHYSLGVNENSNVACIAKYNDGKLIRFVHFKEVDVVLEFGKKTLAEEKVGLKGKIVRSEFDESLTQLYQKDPEKFQKKYREVDYSIGVYGNVFRETYVPWINADFVYEIAEMWDLNPLNMNNKDNYSKGLGLFGTLENCFC